MLLIDKYKKIQTLVLEVSKTGETSVELDALLEELSSEDVKQYFGQNIQENMLEFLVDTYLDMLNQPSKKENKEIRKILEIIDKVFAKAGNLDLKNPVSKLPLLHKLDFHFKKENESNIDHLEALIKLFKKYDADFNILDDARNTVLHRCASRLNYHSSIVYFDVFSIFHEYGCGLHRTNRDNNTVLDCISRTAQSFIDDITVELGGAFKHELFNTKLLERRFNQTQSTQHARHVIVKHGPPRQYGMNTSADVARAEAVDTLINQGLDLSKLYDKDPSGNNGLHYMVKDPTLTSHELESFIKFCHDNLPVLDQRNRKEESVIDLLMVHEREFYLFFCDPRLKASFQSQKEFDSKTIIKVLKKVDQLKLKFQKPIEKSAEEKKAEADMAADRAVAITWPAAGANNPAKVTSLAACCKANKPLNQKTFVSVAKQSTEETLKQAYGKLSNDDAKGNFALFLAECIKELRASRANIKIPDFIADKLNNILESQQAKGSDVANLARSLSQVTLPAEEKAGGAEPAEPASAAPSLQCRK